MRCKKKKEYKSEPNRKIQIPVYSQVSNHELPVQNGDRTVIFSVNPGDRNYRKHN